MARRLGQRKKERFLRNLATMGNVSHAAQAAGFTRTLAYAVRDDDSEFAVAWDAALEEAADRLEAEAWRRGVEGVLEPVYWQGKEVGYVQRYSDTLMVHLLRAHRPAKYRDQSSVEVSGKGGGPITIEVVYVDKGKG